MSGVDERLKLVVEFVNLDLCGLTDEQKYTADDTVIRVAGISIVQQAAAGSTRKQRVNNTHTTKTLSLAKDGLTLLDELPRLQKTARRMLDLFLRQGLSVAKEWPVLHACRVCPQQSPAGDVSLRVYGNGRDMFLVGVFALLNHTTAARLRRCPECAHYFLRSGKQKFCKRACTNRSTWRNMPSEQKERLRQAQYEKSGWTRGTRGGGNPPR